MTQHQPNPDKTSAGQDRVVLFLAYTDVELDACIAALDEVPDLSEVPGSARLPSQCSPRRKPSRNPQESNRG
jgi:hypothetical protein